MPVSKVSSCVKVRDSRIRRIFDYWINPAVSKDDLSGVRQIGMDETLSRKGHNYVTLFADFDQRRVIHACEGQDAATVKSFAGSLQEKGGEVENIEAVSLDMSPAFISGIMGKLPNACMVFDRFHLVQSLNKTQDEVRTAERKGNDLLKGHRYTLLKKYENLSANRKSEPDYVLMMYPGLGEACRLREVFSIADAQEAKGYLWFRYDMASESKMLLSLIL